MDRRKVGAIILAVVDRWPLLGGFNVWIGAQSRKTLVVVERCMAVVGRFY